MKLFKKLVSVLCSVACICCTLSASAFAAEPAAPNIPTDPVMPGTYRIKAAVSNKYLSYIPMTPAMDDIWMPCQQTLDEESKTQLWTIQKTDDNYYSLSTTASDGSTLMFCTLPNQYLCVTSRINGRYDAENYEFALVKNQEGNYVITSVLNGYSFDIMDLSTAENRLIALWPTHGKINQQFILEPVS